MNNDTLFGRFVTRRNKEYGLPIFYVSDIDDAGPIEIQKTFYMPKHKYGDYEWVDPSDFTTFQVRDPETGEIGELVDAEGDPDDEFFYIDFGEGQKRMSIMDFEVIPDSDPLNYENLKRGALEYKAMREVSKKGVLQHLPIAENVQRSIYSMLTGVPARVPENKAGIVLQERLSRPRGAPGAGELERRPRILGRYNRALEIAPLPYGPSEENFRGGKRKNRVRIGTQMARRGSTRRSRGIFTRLYSPVGHLLSAGKESVGAVTNTAKGVVGQGIGGLDRIGRSVTGHANQAVRDVFSRKGGKRRGRGSRKTRKGRKTTRRRR